MRLSHAFVVVLVLHVIAVAGVFAFNSIKARQADIFSAIKDNPAKTAPAAPAVDPATANASSAPAPVDQTTDTPSPIPCGPVPQPAPDDSSAAVSANTPAPQTPGNA